MSFKKSKILFLLVLFSVFCFQFLFVSPVSADYNYETQGRDWMDKIALRVTGKGLGAHNVPPWAVVGEIMGFFFVSIGGICFLLMMIVGGMMWMLAAGDEEKIKKARGILIAAVVGIIILFGGYAFVATIIQLIFGAHGI